MHPHPDLLCLAAGFQFATNVIDEGVRAAEVAAEAGATWLDLNCGCPIYEVRGAGGLLCPC